MITIEVAYASQEQQYLLTLELPEPCRVEEAIIQSGILQYCPEINLHQQKVGIFSKAVALSDWVKDQDRIEIYRPLIIDPKQARRIRANK